MSSILASLVDVPLLVAVRAAVDKVLASSSTQRVGALPVIRDRNIGNFDAVCGDGVFGQRGNNRARQRDGGWLGINRR